MANPPISIPPFSNVPAPGSPLASDWAQQLTQYATDGARAASGTYTPTLTNWTIGGAGASNNAWFTYIGGPDVDDVGLMFANGILVLGTGFAITGGPIISLPPGFKLIGSVSGNHYVGWAFLEDADAGDYTGIVRQWGATTLLVSALRTDSQYLTSPSSISATVPHTWAAGDGFQWNMVGSPVQRT